VNDEDIDIEILDHHNNNHKVNHSMAKRERNERFVSRKE
jgi:hypothetical protein